MMVENNALISGCLLCPNSKELGNDFKRHAFRLRNFQENEHQGYNAHNCIGPKNTCETDRAQHHWEGVGDDDVSNPHREGTDCYAHTTDTGRENLCAENIGDGTKAHNKEAEVGNNTYGWEHSMKNTAQVHQIHNNQNDKGYY